MSGPIMKLGKGPHLSFEVWVRKLTFKGPRWCWHRRCESEEEAETIIDALVAQRIQTWREYAIVEKTVTNRQVYYVRMSGKTEDTPWPMWNGSPI